MSTPSMCPAAAVSMLRTGSARDRGGDREQVRRVGRCRVRRRRARCRRPWRVRRCARWRPPIERGSVTVMIAPGAIRSRSYRRHRPSGQLDLELVAVAADPRPPARHRRPRHSVCSVAGAPSRARCARSARHGLWATPPSATRAARTCRRRPAARRRPRPARTRRRRGREPCGTSRARAIGGGGFDRDDQFGAVELVSRSGSSPGRRCKSATGIRRSPSARAPRLRRRARPRPRPCRTGGGDAVLAGAEDRVICGCSRRSRAARARVHACCTASRRPGSTTHRVRCRRLPPMVAMLRSCGEAPAATPRLAPGSVRGPAGARRASLFRTRAPIRSPPLAVSLDRVQRQRRDVDEQRPASRSPSFIRSTRLVPPARNRGRGGAGDAARRHVGAGRRARTRTGSSVPLGAAVLDRAPTISGRRRSGRGCRSSVRGSRRRRARVRHRCRGHTLGAPSSSSASMPRAEKSGPACSSRTGTRRGRGRPVASGAASFCGQTLGGDDVHARRARPPASDSRHAPAVDEHRARAALPVIAALLGE